MKITQEIDSQELSTSLIHENYPRVLSMSLNNDNYLGIWPTRISRRTQEAYVV